MHRFGTEILQEIHGEQMKVIPMFAWYDFWVGFFWDAKNENLYIFPVPMLGIRIDFKGRS